MKDEEKTREQLITELEDLRKQVACQEAGRNERIPVREELEGGTRCLETTLPASPELALLIDSEGAILALNKVFADTLGKGIEELVGKPAFDFLDPLLDGQKKDGLERALASGEPVRLEVEHSGRIMAHHFCPVSESNGSIQRIAIVSRDVTERRRVEEDLRKEKERFRMISERAPFGLLMISEDGTFRHMNAKFLELFGYDPGEIPNGAQWFKLAFPDADYREFVISRWMEWYGPTEPVELPPRDFVVNCKDGTKKVAQFMGVRMKSGECLITCQDITELKRTEEALRSSEETLKSILSASPVAISYVQNARLKWTNQAMAEMFGYTHEREYLEKSVREFYANREEYERVLEMFRSGLRAGIPLETEAQFLRKDGSVFWGQLKVSVLPRGEDGEKASISTIADITARKHAEAKLRCSEDRYRTLVEESFDGILIQSRKSIVFANSRLHKMLGYNDGELVGMDHWLIYHPDYQEMTRRRAEARMRGETVLQRYEVKLLRKDGSTLDGELNARAITVGPEPGVQVWIKDITERKISEQELRESEDRFRRLSDAAAEGILIHNGGVVVDANEAFVRMFGYELSELVGTSIERLASAESWSTIAAHIASGYDKPYVVTGVRKDGSSFYCRLTGKPYLYRGELRRMVTVHDITERIAAEEALRRSQEEFRRLYEESKRAEDLYRSLLHSSADAVVVYDLEGNTQYVNNSFSNIFGWTIDDLRNRPIPYVPDSEREATMNMIRSVLKDGVPCTGFETKRYTKDGRLLDISSSGSRYHDHEGNPAGVLVVLRDVTESKKLEEQLRQAVKMEAIGRLAGGVAHDFNNLLTAVMGYSNMLAQQFPKGSPEYEKLAQITRAGKRAAELTQQLLAFGRKQVLEIKPLDLNLIISDFERMLCRLIGENIEVVTSLSPSLGTACGDQGQIEQILMNLAVNARDAMSEGGTLTIETANASLGEEYSWPNEDLTPGDYVMFTVSDTGRGMKASVRSRIFDPFFTTKQKGVGTGLGLSTVYGIVKQHRGHISVYSEPGRGTTFKVYLPRVQGIPEHDTADPIRIPRPTGAETILLVEDEDVVRELSREVLESLGYTALTARDPHQAIAVSREHEGPIHLLLTDIVLPKMDGRSLFDFLSKERSEMKVLFVSGYTENFIVHHGVLDKGLNFLQKPFTADSLAMKVREVLGELKR
jgi:two-component system cell cycle sensor histidine kinase/response regulator CckA